MNKGATVLRELQRKLEERSSDSGRIAFLNRVNRFVGRASASLQKPILADLYLTWVGWPVEGCVQVSPRCVKGQEIMD